MDEISARFSSIIQRFKRSVFQLFTIFLQLFKSLPPSHYHIYFISVLLSSFDLVFDFDFSLNFCNELHLEIFTLPISLVVADSYFKIAFAPAGFRECHLVIKCSECGQLFSTLVLYRFQSKLPFSFCLFFRVTVPCVSFSLGSPAII